MDTVLPRVSSAVGRPVCVCETYLHPLHRENVYSLRLASRHWPRHHHSPSGQDALRTDRGTRTARTEARRTGPLGVAAADRPPRARGRGSDGARRCRGTERGAIVSRPRSWRSAQAAERDKPGCLRAQELCPPHVVAFYPDSVASDGVLYRVDRTTTHRSRGAVSRRHRPSLRRGAGPLRRPHFGSFDSLKT